MAEVNADRFEEAHAFDLVRSQDDALSLCCWRLARLGIKVHRGDVLLEVSAGFVLYVSFGSDFRTAAQPLRTVCHNERERRHPNYLT